MERGGNFKTQVKKWPKNNIQNVTVTDNYLKTTTTSLSVAKTSSEHPLSGMRGA